MNLPKAYISGFQKAIKLPRMLFILYFANFITALILALSFKNVIQNSFGQSNSLSSLISDFDFTAFSDIMFNHGDAIMGILGGIIWLVIAYYLLTTFLTGGIIETLNKDKFTTSSFFGGAAYNFFRLLGLNLIVLSVQIFFLLLVYVPLILILQKVLDNMTPELTLYYFAIGGFVFHLLIFLMISMIGDYAKFYLVVNNSFNIFKGFWNGVKYVFGHFLKTYFLYLFLLFLPAVIMYLYLYLERDIKMATVAGILIVFGMQQAFMLLRVFLRTWVLASQFKMYYDDVAKNVNNQIVFSVVDTKTNSEKVIIEEPVKNIVTETPIKETKKEIVETKEDVKTVYAIDFNKTFTSSNEDDHGGEKIISEAEMLKKLTEEETLLKDSNPETLVVEEKIAVIENQNPTIEKVEPIILKIEDESGVAHNIVNEEKAPIIETETINIEKVEQNVPDVENKSEVADNKDNEESTPMIESELANIERVEQNVLNVEDESGVEDNKEKVKKSNSDIMEFEL